MTKRTPEERAIRWRRYGTVGGLVSAMNNFVRIRDDEFFDPEIRKEAEALVAQTIAFHHRCQLALKGH